MPVDSKKEQAIRLRRQGKSIREIVKILNSSASSVSLWCRNIELSNKAVERLKMMRSISLRALADYRKFKQKIKEKEQKELSLKAIQKLRNIDRNHLFLAGISLYWAEGFKKGHKVGFSTMDLKFAKFMLWWLSEFFDVNRTDFTVRISINKLVKHREKEIIKYWQSNLKVPFSQFTKNHIFKATRKTQYKNHNGYNGVLRITVKKSSKILRWINALIDKFPTRYLN